MVGYSDLDNSIESDIYEFSFSDKDNDGLYDFQEIGGCNSVDNYDSDNDGLSDGLEIENGFNPCLFDTDGDGISDGYEFTNSSDVLLADSWEDSNSNGKSNWFEYAKSNTNDLDIVNGDRVLELRDMDAYALTGFHADSESSMTLMYWVMHHEYDGEYQLTGSRDGGDHRFYVGRDGSKLIAGVGRNIEFSSQDKFDPLVIWNHVSVTYDKDSKTLSGYLNGINVFNKSNVRFKGKSSRSMFIGAMNNSFGGAFFINGQVDDVQVWGRALSDSEVQGYMLTPPVAGEADLLAYYDFSRAKGRWVENVASGEFDALLSADGLLSPAEALADTDGDGIPDRHELAMCTDSTLADTDGDGLSDGDELGVSGTQAPSNACRADSDGDGIPDGVEAALGSDLMVADTGQDADSDGVSNWSEYVALTASEEEPLMSGDHTLDLRSLEAYATTGYHASGNT
ncbi:LamG domain-containing protein, partial [Grimontia marina]|uniref:LamG domain-containing protein n=1 Tax=Grimontia marina TaxID=646534 RepID=UPI0018DE7FB0